MFKGSIVALITPMHLDGSIDKKSFCELIEWHIAEKTDAIVVAGSTGEGTALTDSEHNNLITWAVKQAAKRIPIIAGTGSNSTQHSFELTQQAKQAGVDACLIVTPYYNRPTQNGLFEHYKAITKVNIPIIIYNVPGRTGCDMVPETIGRIATLPNIIGVKEATGKLERALEIEKLCPANFMIYSGDDPTAMELMLNGANGDISITSNVAPRKMHDLCKAAISKNRALAEKLNAELAGLHKKLCIESNPIPTKWALNKMGKIPAGIRLPLLSLDAKYHSEVQAALSMAGIDIKVSQDVLL